MFKTYSEARMLPPRIDLKTKPKEVKGLFDDADLKKSEKKITDNLDKMTGKNPQDFEQTDLF